MKRVLVTGGAGYIGSHTARALAEEGHHVVILDSLVHGHRAATAGFPLVVADVSDRQSVAAVLRERRIEAVVHFAACIRVAESVADPGSYFANNTGGTLSLLRAMAEVGVAELVFSSTAGVYGQPQATPITEDAEKRPENPYGASKWLVEQQLPWFAQAHGLRAVSLRYFNAAGAHPDGSLGEDHRPETHLIPLALEVALGRRPVLEIFGEDYPTLDGTCIRDFVHVCDLASAHVAALRGLAAAAAGKAYNVGLGTGHSVRQVVEAARRVTGHPVPIAARPRRPGDPPTLVADPQRLKAELGWRPAFRELDEIMETAWRWQRAHPGGYPG